MKGLVALLRSGVWILEGQEKGSGHTLKIFFTGSVKQKAYVASISLRDGFSERFLGKRFIWSTLYLLYKYRRSCNLAFVEGNYLHRRLYQRKDDFYLPLWLKTCANLPLPVKNSSYKEDIRRIKKNGLDYFVTRDSKELDDFYNNMYRPTVNASHGDSAIELDYTNMKQSVADGACVLLLVTKEGKSIAGVLVTVGKLPRLWAIGVRDNESIYHKCAAAPATYHFGADYLQKLGYTEMHLGMSRSVLEDGVLQYKNKFGQQVIGIEDTGFVLKVLKKNIGTDAFLINNPFVYQSDGHLYAAIFLAREERPTSKEFDRMRRKYFIGGLSGMNVFRQGEATGVFLRLL